MKTCRDLWREYERCLDRVSRADRRFRRAAIEQCLWAMDNYFRAVEHELAYRERTGMVRIRREHVQIPTRASR